MAGKPGAKQIYVFRDVKTYIHESNLIEGIDDDQADEDSFKAWEYLKNRCSTKQQQRMGLTPHQLLDQRVILQIQEKITLHQDIPEVWKGRYRSNGNQVVTVNGNRTMNPAMVKRAMEAWLEDVPNHLPEDNHIEFEKIHPFMDGNGRTGRMLMWWQELYLNSDKPTLFRNRDKQEYYKMFEEEE